MEVTDSSGDWVTGVCVTSVEVADPDSSEGDFATLEHAVKDRVNAKAIMLILFNFIGTLLLVLI
jgi:hypothetical protein